MQPPRPVEEERSKEQKKVRKKGEKNGGEKGGECEICPNFHFIF